MTTVYDCGLDLQLKVTDRMDGSKVTSTTTIIRIIIIDGSSVVKKWNTTLCGEWKEPRMPPPSFL